jgi:hypothetical protein
MTQSILIKFVICFAIFSAFFNGFILNDVMNHKRYLKFRSAKKNYQNLLT